MKSTFSSPTRLILFVAFIILTTVIACRKNIFDRVPETQLTETYHQYKVKYQSSTEDSILHFELEISKTEKSADIIHETIDIDLKGNKYLTSIYQILQDRSLNSKYSNITEQQAREICISLREVIAEHTKSLTKEQIKSPNVQGMYMSLAFARRILKNKLGVSLMESKILARKNALRSTTPPPTTTPAPVNPVLTQPSYVQDVYEGYELGLSGFVLNEDIIVDRQAFLTIINQDAAAVLHDDQGLYVFQEVLNSIPFNSFSLKDLSAEMDFYVAQHPENNMAASGCGVGWWPSGSSHGCCGNYSGCCYYWNWKCYVHDKICTKCTPRWFCLSGCVPDPVQVNVPKPFTFIEDGNEVAAHLPTPLPAGIYYKISYDDLRKNIPQLYTTIVVNPSNKKYYTASNYATFVPDGYYDSPSEIDVDLHKYYHIESGIITEIWLIIDPI